MAALTAQQRQEVWDSLMQEASRLRSELGLTKADLQAAVDATDQWIDDNASVYNTALPVAARTALTAQQKALLFFFVANKRFGVL